MLHTRILNAASIAVLLPAAVVATSCATDAPVPSVSVTDSAGIEIVHSAAPGWADGDAWTVTMEPSLAIGAAEGDPRYMLDRVESPFRMGDGRIVVPNGISRLLRVYSPEGEHLVDLGGQGDGPGELQDVAQGRPARGDSIAVYDYSTSSISLWDHDGEFGRRTRIQAPSYIYVFLGILDDGSLVAGDGRPNMSPAQGEVTRDSAHVLLYHPDGTPADSVTSVAGFVRFTGPLPFTPRLHWATHESAIYVAEADHYEVRVYDPALSRERRVRWTGPERALTARHLSQLEDSLEQEVEGDRLAARRRTLAEAPHSDELPALSAIVVDQEGYLWVRRYNWGRDNMWTTSRSAPSSWWIFDPDGAWLGGVELPPRLEVSAIGEDWILGVERDELDVPRVVMYPLERR